MSEPRAVLSLGPSVLRCPASQSPALRYNRSFHFAFRLLVSGDPKMSQHGSIVGTLSAAVASLVFASAALAQERDRERKGELPPFEEVSKGYEKVVSTADGAQSLYTLFVDRKKNQVLAELPRGWESQKHFIAITQASGGVFAGLQGPERYVYWKRYDDRLALVEPQLETRSTGEVQSKNSVERLFTDRVLLDVPIVANGPNGQPVIDLDELLLDRSGGLMPTGGGGP